MVASFYEWGEEIEEIRDLGGQVYVEAVQSGRAKESGIDAGLEPPEASTGQS